MKARLGSSMEGIAECYEKLALFKRSQPSFAPRLAERLVGMLPARDSGPRVCPGSFPSERSLETAHTTAYGKPFWPIFLAYRELAPNVRKERGAWALAKGLGFGMIASCRREGAGSGHTGV
jgi:hypothetical protein